MDPFLRGRVDHYALLISRNINIAAAISSILLIESYIGECVVISPSSECSLLNYAYSISLLFKPKYASLGKEVLTTSRYKCNAVS